MLKAKDIMTPEVLTISASSMVSEAIGLMKKKGIHALIVDPQGDDRAFGIVTEADIAYKVIANCHDPKALAVRDIMTQPCITIRPDMSIENVARLFADKQIHRAPIVKDNKLQGIVSVSDITKRGEWWQ